LAEKDKIPGLLKRKKRFFLGALGVKRESKKARGSNTSKKAYLRYSRLSHKTLCSSLNQNF
jgi:hypothetical protein